MIMFWIRRLQMDNERMVKKVYKLKASLLNVGYTLGGTRVHVMDSHMERQNMWLPAVSSTWRGRIGNLTLQVNQSWDHTISLKQTMVRLKDKFKKQEWKCTDLCWPAWEGEQPHCKLRLAGMLAFLWKKEHVRPVIQPWWRTRSTSVWIAQDWRKRKGTY